VILPEAEYQYRGWASSSALRLVVVEWAIIHWLRLASLRSFGAASYWLKALKDIGLVSGIAMHGQDGLL
jgi:hypothetical protein